MLKMKPLQARNNYTWYSILQNQQTKQLLKCTSLMFGLKTLFCIIDIK